MLLRGLSNTVLTARVLAAVASGPILCHKGVPVMSSPAPILSMLLIPLAIALCLGAAGCRPATVGGGTDGDEADIECREDFLCWSTKHLPNAVELCPPMIEDRAPFGL